MLICLSHARLHARAVGASGTALNRCAVDVTNYVLLELKPPLHAFDLDQLSGGIGAGVQRRRDADTVGCTEQTLQSGTLVIADHEKPLAMAGIMGGEAGGVSDKTTKLFLESAFFTPELMAGRAHLTVFTLMRHIVMSAVWISNCASGNGARDGSFGRRWWEPGRLPKLWRRQICRSTSRALASHKSKNSWVLLSIVSRSSAFSKGSILGCHS